MKWQMNLNWLWLSLVCSLLLFAQGSSVSHNIYINPNSLNPTETGGFESPFRNLSSAFLEIEKTIALLPPDDLRNVLIHLCLKEDTIFNSFGTLRCQLNKETQQYRYIHIVIKTYSSSLSPERTLKPATLLFSSPTDHLVIISDFAVNFFNIRFQLDLPGEFDHPELVYLEGEGFTKLTLETCEFSDSRVSSKNQNKTIIHSKGSLSILKSTFKNITSTIPFLFFEEQRRDLAPLFAFKGNQVADIELQNGISFFKGEYINSMRFENNLIERVQGIFLESSRLGSIALNNNSFSDLKGTFPLRFDSVHHIKISEAFFWFTNPSGLQEGLIWAKNVSKFDITKISLEGYRGSSAIILSQKEDIMRNLSSYIAIQDSIFKGNFIQVQDNTRDQKASLVALESNKNSLITILNCTFSDNSIMTRNGLIPSTGISTLSIQAPESRVVIKRSKFTANKALNSLNNIYVNASELEVTNSTFHRNQRTDCQLQDKDCSGLLLLAKEMKIENNLFEEDRTQKTFKEAFLSM